MDREIKKRHPRLRKILIITASSLLLTGVIIYAISRATTSVYRADSTAMTFGEVVEGDFNDYISLTGKVETGTTVQISAIETGIVESKPVEEGAVVNEGDIIITLRNPNLQQQILDSESQLAERQNMLRDTEIAMEKERLQLKQDLLATQMEANRMRRICLQQKTLYDEHLTSREDYLKAQEDSELADEKMKLLKERIHQDSLYRSVQIGMMKESLDNMRRNFELVRQRADNLNIRASHSGQLGALNAELGQNIPAGQQVGQINILGNFKIAANIDEHYIDRVAKGLSGTMERNNRNYKLIISKIYPEVTSGQFRADLTFDSSMPENIRVGQTYHINLQLGDPVKAIMVPRGSFFQTTGGHWAYVMEPDGRSAVKRKISIGRQNPRFYEVTGGLRPGEKIITSSYSAYGESDRIILRD